MLLLNTLVYNINFNTQIYTTYFCFNTHFLEIVPTDYHYTDILDRSSSYLFATTPLWFTCMVNVGGSGSGSGLYSGGLTLEHSTEV